MKPLEGVKILELSTYVAAPSCARMLAEWGADVIKVEPPAGDVNRIMGPIQNIPIYDKGNPCFDNENAGKRYLAIDLKSEDGMIALHKLLEKTDVMITNYRYKALQKMHLTYEELKEKYPRLIFADVLGYGEFGPDCDKPGFDFTAFYARTGMMLDMSPLEADRPLNAVSGFGDHVTGMALASGICAALYRRTQCGLGDHVDSALFQVGIYTLTGGILAAYHGRPYPRSRMNTAQPTSNTYKCKDGKWLMLAANVWKLHWPKLCNEVFDRPELGTDPRFVDAMDVKKNAHECIEILDEIFLTKDRDEWLELIRKADLAHEVVQHMGELPDDPQATENNFLFSYEYPNGNKEVFSNAPVRFGSTPFADFRPAGPVGCDTREILKEVGYSDEKIDQMLEAKTAVIAGERWS